MKYWWLWKNFVNGNPEYWAFDHLYPVNMDNGDPQVLGEPCGYALFKPSRPGRTVCPADEQRAIARATGYDPSREALMQAHFAPSGLWDQKPGGGVNIDGASPQCVLRAQDAMRAIEGVLTEVKK